MSFAIGCHEAWKKASHANKNSHGQLNLKKSIMFIYIEIQLRAVGTDGAVAEPVEDVAVEAIAGCVVVDVTCIDWVGSKRRSRRRHSLGVWRLSDRSSATCTFSI